MLILWISLAMAEEVTVCQSGCVFSDLGLALLQADPNDEVLIEDDTPLVLDATLINVPITLKATTADPVSLSLNGPLRIESTVTVENFVLSGSSATLVEVAAGHSGTVRSVTVDTHTVGSVTAFTTDGALVLDGVTFKQIDSSGQPAAVLAGPGSSLTVRNSRFESLSGQNGGGIAAHEATVVVEDTVFEDCSGNLGGAMAFYDSQVTLHEVQVLGGASTEGGSAVYAEGGEVSWTDGVVCNASGDSQIETLGTALGLSSMTLRDGTIAVRLTGGELVGSHLEVLGNIGALRVDAGTALLDNSLVAHHSNTALAESNGTIIVAHSAFYANAQDGTGAPGSNPVFGDPLIDYPGIACEPVPRLPGSPLPISGDDGRGVGDIDFVPPWRPDTAYVDTGEPHIPDTGRIEWEGPGDPPVDTSVPNNDMTGRVRDTSDIEPPDEPDPVDTGNNDLDTGVLQRHSDSGPIWIEDTAPQDITDGDSGDTSEPPPGDTTDDTAVIDQDPIWTAETADDTGPGTVTFGTGDTGNTGDTGPPKATDTDTPTVPDTGTPPTPATQPPSRASQVPGFACTTASGGSQGGLWLGLPGLLLLLGWRRRR